MMPPRGAVGSCRRRRLAPLNEDNGRFLLLAALIAAYLSAGATVFSALESPSEAAAQLRWNRTLHNFSRIFNISLPELRAFLRSYEAAMAAGIRVDALRPRWDFPGAFYFVGTVVSTIGERRPDGPAAQTRPSGGCRGPGPVVIATKVWGEAPPRCCGNRGFAARPGPSVPADLPSWESRSHRPPPAARSRAPALPPPRSAPAPAGSQQRRPSRLRKPRSSPANFCCRRLGSLVLPARGSERGWLPPV